MRPILFKIGGLEFPTFFFMIMLATLFTTFYGVWLAKKDKIEPVVMLDFGIISIIASVIGSRVFHIIIENPSYYLEKPIRVFYFWQGGFVSIGAFTFSAISMIVYLKIKKLDVWRYMDIVATAIPFAIFFVRLGCLGVGCCYGKPTDFFLHLVFTNPGSTAGYYHLGEPLHATQVYASLNALIMAGVLYLIYKHKRVFYGQMVCSFFIYYGITRFFIEFLRGDADRGLFFGGVLSTGQIAMIFSFIAGIIIFIIRRNKRIEM